MSTAVAERPGVMPNPAIVTVTNPATPPASTLASEFATINDYATGSQRVSNDFKAKWQSTYKAAFQVVVSGGLNGSYTAKQYADFANAYEQAKLAGLVGVGTVRGGTSNFDSMYSTALAKTSRAGAGLPPSGGLPGGGLPGGGVPGTGNGGSSVGGSGGGLDTVLQQMLSSDIKKLDAQIAASKQLTADFKAKWQSTYKPAFEVYASGNVRNSYTATQYNAFVDAYQKLSANPVISAGQWNALRSAYDQLTQSGPGRGIGSVPGSGAGGAIGGGGSIPIGGGNIDRLQPTRATELAALDSQIKSSTLPASFKAEWQNTLKAAFQAVAQGTLDGSVSTKQLSDYAAAYKKLSGYSVLNLSQYTALKSAADTVADGTGLTGTSRSWFDVQRLKGSPSAFVVFYALLDANTKLSDVNRQSIMNAVMNLPTGFENFIKDVPQTMCSPADLAKISLAGPMGSAVSDLVSALYRAGLSNLDPYMQAVYQNLIDAQGIAFKATSIGSYTSLVNSTFVQVGLINNALLAVAPYSGTTEVQQYVSSAYNELRKSVGGIATFAEAIDVWQTKLDELANYTIDSATGLKFSPAAMQFITDGAGTTATSITYAGKTRLSLKEAALGAAKDLLQGASEFMADARNGLVQVVQNKKMADALESLNKFFSVLSGVLSFGANYAGLSAIGGKFQAATADAAKNNKPINWSAVDIASTVKETISTAKTVFDTGSKWLPKAQKSATGLMQYRWNDDFTGELGQSMKTLFPDNDVTSSLRPALDKYKNEFNSLMKELLKNSSNTSKDYLGIGRRMTDLGTSGAEKVIYQELGGMNWINTLNYAYIDFDGKKYDATLSITSSQWTSKPGGYSGIETYKQDISIPGYLYSYVEVERWAKNSPWPPMCYNIRVVGVNPAG